ncbi:MAG TPA: hypothetical protein VIJ95_12525 [Hanamia sp.]
MLEEIYKYSSQGKKGKLIALTLILGTSYSLIWQLLEPLNLEIVNSNKTAWRWILIGLTLIVSIVTFFILFPKKYLEQFGFEPNDTNLQTTLKTSGNPIITIVTDGYHGKVFSLKAKHSEDEMDWQVKTSAHKANSIVFLYSPGTDLTFYLKVNLISKDKTIQNLKWIRLEPNISIPDNCNDQAEMAYPILAENQDGFLRTFVNINKAVIQTHGQKGWQYDKIILFRIRGTGKIKKITLA